VLQQPQINGRAEFKFNCAVAAQSLKKHIILPITVSIEIVSVTGVLYKQLIQFNVVKTNFF
jgi:hypothetical protein